MLGHNIYKYIVYIVYIYDYLFLNMLSYFQRLDAFNISHGLWSQVLQLQLE